MPVSSPEHLSQHHRDTLAQILQHPVSHNIEWHDVESLLGEVGSIEERHDGKFVVAVGDGRIFIDKPRHKDIDTQLVVDLRHLLIDAGFGAVVKPGTED